MYAIIETGGKQYRVEEGGILEVEKLSGEAGDALTLDKVLLVSGDDVRIGNPLISGVVVNASIVAQVRDKKKLTFRYKSKNRYSVRKGHRQPLTRIKIESIAL